MASHSQGLPGQRSLHWWTGSIALGVVVLALLLGTAIWLAGKSARSALIEQFPAPGRLVDVGGYKLHLHCMGQGKPTVLLESGLGGFSIDWALVQPEIASFSRVCVYDRAGYGWSEPSPYPRTSATMVKELQTLLAHAGVEKPYILVGHSFGGMNVRLYAHNYPDEVVGMVLVDSVHEERDIRLSAYGKAGQQLVQQFRLLALLRSLGIVALFPEKIPNPGFPEEAFAQYRAILATTKYFETSNAETLAQERNFTEFRSANAVALDNLPLVVLSRGLGMPIPGLSQAENQQNEQVWREMQTELAALSPNSQHIIAEKSGHSIALQQPELVVEVIRQLVNGVSVNIQDSTLPIATATLGMSTPLSLQDAARFTQSEFTLLTQFSAGRIFYVGVGGDIDGVVNPALVVPPGIIARVIVVNGDGMAHDLILPDFGVHSATIDRKGQTTEVMFTVNEDQAGNYPYFCSKPGHRESGQEGRLLVPITLKNDPE